MQAHTYAWHCKEGAPYACAHLYPACLNVDPHTIPTVIPQAQLIIPPSGPSQPQHRLRLRVRRTKNSERVRWSPPLCAATTKPVVVIQPSLGQCRWYLSHPSSTWSMKGATWGRVSWCHGGRVDLGWWQLCPADSAGWVSTTVRAMW